MAQIKWQEVVVTFLQRYGVQCHQHIAPFPLSSKMVNILKKFPKMLLVINITNQVLKCQPDQDALAQKRVHYQSCDYKWRLGPFLQHAMFSTKFQLVSYDSSWTGRLSPQSSTKRFDSCNALLMALERISIGLNRYNFPFLIFTAL